MASQIQFGYAYHDSDDESFVKHLDHEAQACADALSRSERGTRALRSISEFLATGGFELDASNQRAVMLLLGIAWKRPSATDNAIVRALTH